MFRDDNKHIPYQELPNERLNNLQSAEQHTYTMHVYQNDPTDLQLRIVGGTNIFVGGKDFNFNDLLSPVFTPPMVGSETHLLYAFNNAGSLGFGIKTTGFTAGDPSTYDVEFAMVEVTLIAGQTQILNADILDVRSILVENEDVDILFYENINAGELCRIIDDGGIAKARKVYDGITLYSDDFVGICQFNVLAGDNGKVRYRFIDRNQTGLTPASQYYIQANGTLGTTQTAFGMVGYALNSTDILFNTHR